MTNTSLLAIAVAVSTLGVAPSLATADDHCEPSTPRLLFIVDKSSSMVGATVDGSTLWDLAVEALDMVTAVYNDDAEMGLMLFPGGPGCTLPVIDVAPAVSNHDAIIAGLGGPPPAPGAPGAYATPMHQTLSQAAQEPVLQPGDDARVAIIITDGEQFCAASDPETEERLRPIDAIDELNQAGVITYVVGFGEAYDAYVLNQMAVAAGTQIANCNPDGALPNAPDSCFYKAENSQELALALAHIVTTVTGELCDGIDNDCDGEVDEELVQECDTSCGSGGGSSVCTNGAWGECEAPANEVETCDGFDNDCDGMADEEDDGPICGEGSVCDSEAGECAYDGGAGGCGCELGGGDARSILGGVMPMMLAFLVLIARRRREDA